MKQVLTTLRSTLLSSSLHYSIHPRKVFSKYAFLGLLVSFAIISSSFQSGNHLKKSVPFKGKIDIYFTASGVFGTGEGSHVGKLTFFGQDDESNFPFLTGNETITAANGDKIIAKHSGYVMDLGNGILKLTFNSTITGGTGRFTGATGSFTEYSLANENLGTAHETFEGTISY